VQRDFDDVAGVVAATDRGVWFAGGDMRRPGTTPPETAVLRCVIDAMVFDAIAAEPALLAGVDRLTSARRLELLAGASTMTEIAAVPDRTRRRVLQRVRVLVIAPPDPVDPGIGAQLGRLLGSPGVSDEDAAIAVTAASRAVPLVTEDRDLRVAVSAHLPEVALWRWASDLRPRIEALLA
jgi:predicted nucleic acid-binding protein